MHTEVDNLLSFTIFDAQNRVTLVDASKKNKVVIEKVLAQGITKMMFKIIDNG